VARSSAHMIASPLPLDSYIDMAMKNAQGHETGSIEMMQRTS